MSINDAMQPPLLGPKLKVERAKRHLADFNEVIRVFFESNPYELVADRDAATGDQIYRVRVNAFPPSDLSIIAGDVVHNLRSALDQMVCALIRANRNQVSGGNGFPISGSKARFESASIGKLKNTSPQAKRFIFRLKPYNGGNKALWLLSELDNMDKHNQIVPVAAGQVQVMKRRGIPGMFVAPDGSISLFGGPPGSVPAGFDFGWGIPDDASIVALLHDNCEVYRERAALAHMPNETCISIKIIFGKTHLTDFEPITEVLEGLIDLTERIIDIVERRIL